MAGRDPLNSIADVAALQAEADKVIAIVRSIDEAVKSVSQIKSDYKGAEGSAAQKKASEDLAAANKKVKDAQAELNEQTQKAANLQGELAKQIALTREQNKQRAKELAAEAREAAGLNDAYKKLELQYNAAQREAKNLAATQGITSEAAQKAAEKANALSKELKAIDASVGQFQRNVGNYPESAKIIVDALERARSKFTELSKAADTTPAALQRAKSQFEALRGVADDRQFLNYASNVGSAQQEVKAFTRVLIDLEQRNQGNTEAAIKLRKHLAELTDQIADTKAEVKALSSDTRSFDLFAGSVNFAADAFQTFAGAVALGTDSEEEAQQSLKTLVAIQTVANGVKGIGTELTTRGTAANKVYAFAQNQVAIAMDTTATAGVRLRAALITLGIGALIIGIGLLVANFSKLKDIFSGLSETQKALNDINKKAIEGYVQERVHVESLVREVNNENTSKTRKKEIIKELNTLSPTYFSNIKSETDLQDKLNESVIKYIKAIELKARAKAAENALVEAEKGVVDRQIELERQLEAAKTQTFDTEERKQRHINGLKKLIDEGTDSELQALQKKAEPIRKVMAQINAELDALGGDPSKPIQLPFVSNKKAYTDELQAQAEAFKKLSESEEAYLIMRLGARENALTLQKKILDRQRNVELENLDSQINAEQAKGLMDENVQKGFAQKRLEIQNDFAEKSRGLEREYSKDISNIRQTFLAHQLELEKEYNDLFMKDQEEKAKASEDLLQQQLQKRKDYLSEARDIELKNLEEQYASGKFKDKIDQYGNLLSADEQYQKERQRLEDEADIYILRAEEDLVKKQISLKRALGLDTVELAAALANLELQIEQKKDKAKIDSNLKAVEEKKKIAEKEKEIAEKAADFVVAFASGANERALNAIQDQIDANTKLRDAEIERVNQSTLNEQDKAARIAQINATAQIKQDQLEAKQRQEKLREAKFERDAQVLRILGETLFQAAKAGWITPTAIAIETIGALEIATLLAKPLPRYATGTDNSPEGFAIVGEEGPELRKDPDGKLSLTPGQATLTYLQAGTQIIPHDEVNQMMLQAMMQNTVKMPEREDLAAKKIDRLTSIIQWQHQELINAWSRIAKQNRTIIPPNYKDFGKDYLP